MNYTTLSSYFSGGSITNNTITVNHTLNVNLSGYGFSYYSSNYYYYSLKSVGYSYNNSDIYIAMNGAVKSSGYYYGIFGNFSILYQTRMWGTQIESTYYTGILLTNMSTALQTTCVSINMTI